MRVLILTLTVLLTPLPLAARDIAGQFDFYVLAIGWQPSWCSRTGDNRNAPECRAGTGRDFVVHGLWPQYDNGWPKDCTTRERNPSRRESAAMADVMGSGGLAWYQWQKHGRCTGLSAADYYAATRQAAEIMSIPPVLDDLARDVMVPPRVIEEAILEVNPGLHSDGVTVMCRGGNFTEVRVCLTHDLEPRLCPANIRRDCDQAQLLIEAVR